jgi:two-component system LytT family sensor kinase
MYKKLNVKFGNDMARLEFWIVTGCLVLTLLISVIDTTINNRAQLSSVLMPQLFSYCIVFISYLLLCFYVAPAFESRGKKESTGTLFVFILISGCYLTGIVNIYFSALLAIKLLILFFNRNKENKESALLYEAALLTASWILISVGLLYIASPAPVNLYVLFDLPAAMIVYLYAVNVLLPWATYKNKGFGYYFQMMCLLIAFCGVALFIICWCFEQGGRGFFNPVASSLTIYIENKSSEVVLNSILTQLFIVMPLARNIYKGRRSKKDEEIKTLKAELGKSDANLTFLKSQINPHFLFNALNTLYGTALQENAGRTGEGIQKLGDMMRFMLHENIQDKILLSRDIEYLKNYIILQKLRISTSSDITIETQIEDPEDELMITPMLLIPFVENAFKHGISRLNPSHIKVTMQTSGNTLYFDVHNSTHIRTANDPEKGQSGIGLENVKQRLTLLYPGRHELIIRENAKEFFIHLTLQLDINN